MEQVISLPQNVLPNGKTKYWDVLYQLRLKSILCDIELSVPCQNEPSKHIFIPAHKLVLVGSSSYFEEALAKDDLLDVYSFDGISENDLRTVLDYVYHQKSWSELTATQEAAVAANILGIRRHDLVERTTTLFQDQMGNNVMVVPLAAKEKKKQKQMGKKPRIIVEDVEAEFKKCMEKSAQKAKTSSVDLEQVKMTAEPPLSECSSYSQEQEQNSYITLEHLLRSGKSVGDDSQVVFQSEGNPSDITMSQLTLLADASASVGTSKLQDTSHSEAHYHVASVNYQDSMQEVVAIVQNDEESNNSLELDTASFVVQLASSLQSDAGGIQADDGDISCDADKAISELSMAKDDSNKGLIASQNIPEQNETDEGCLPEATNDVKIELIIEPEEVIEIEKAEYIGDRKAEIPANGDTTSNVTVLEQTGNTKFPPMIPSKTRATSKRKTTSMEALQIHDKCLDEDHSKEVSQAKAKTTMGTSHRKSNKSELKMASKPVEKTTTDNEPRYTTRKRQFKLPEGLKPVSKRTKGISKKVKEVDAVEDDSDNILSSVKTVEEMSFIAGEGLLSETTVVETFPFTHQEADEEKKGKDEDQSNEAGVSSEFTGYSSDNHGEGVFIKANPDELSENDEASLEERISIHGEEIEDDYEEKPEFICEECGAEFNTSDDLQDHVNRQHEDYKHSSSETQDCEMCGKNIRGGPSDMEKHIRNVHHSVKNHQCPVCSQTLPTLKELREHKLTVHNIQPHHCDQCNSSFKSYEGYKIHMFKMHTNVKPSHMCEICGKVFKMRHELYRHVKYTHMEKAAYTCTMCPREFKTRSSVRRHMRTFHSDQRNFSCDVCQSSFKSVTDMKKHRQLHFRKDNPLGADRSRVSRDKSPPRPCKYCGKVFKKKENLLCHEKNVHEEKEKGVSYICGVCDKHFSVQLYLQQHIVAKHRPLRYTCPTCDKGYTHRYMLNRHTPRCKGVPTYMKPFKCSTCNAAFLNKSNFTRHLQDQERCRKKMGNTTVDYLVYMKQHEEGGSGEVTNEETIEASMVIGDLQPGSQDNTKAEFYEIVKEETDSKKTQLLQIGNNWIELQEDTGGMLQLHDEGGNVIGDSAAVVEVVTGDTDQRDGKEGMSSSTLEGDVRNDGDTISQLNAGEIDMDALMVGGNVKTGENIADQQVVYQVVSHE